MGRLNFTISNNKTYFYLSITLFIVVFITLLSFPLKYSLDHLLSSRQSSFVAGVSTRILTILILWKIIISVKLSNFTRISYKIKDPYPLILPSIILGLIFFSKFNLTILKTSAFLFFTLSHFIVGLTEEISFRGVVLPLLIKKTNRIVISAILSSIPFALFHYVNLLIQPGNWGGITSQVVFAFVIGIFFSGVFLRTESILITALLHTFINIALADPEYFQQDYTEISNQAINTNFSISTSSWIVFSTILSGALFTLWRANKARILSRLVSPFQSEDQVK